MRILLILLQTAAFLILVAAVLFSLYLTASMACDLAFLPARVIAFVFGNWVLNALIFIVLAAFNIWFVLGPLMKVEDPVRRTVQHLCLIFVQTVLLLAVAVIAFASTWYPLFERF
jgi:hypothetical protein